jgi:hypothetical protein
MPEDRTIFVQSLLCGEEIVKRTEEPLLAKAGRGFTDSTA